MARRIVWWVSLGAFPGDTLTYYLAGLRLDSGHALYDLRPNDVWLYGHPEFPLLEPAAHRCPAPTRSPLLPAGSGMIVWLVAMYSWQSLQ